MVALTKSENSANLNENIEKLSLILSNLKPNLTTGTLTQAQIQQQASLNSEIAPVYNKSKFKTIKIFVASNRNEFEAECEYLLTETQLELQEEFIQYGYDLQFIDFNLNLNFDPCKDPFFFASLLKEIDDCSASSEGVFFITLIGNRYGDLSLPNELSQSDFQTIINTSDSDRDLNLFQTWYNLDENSYTPIYKLKNVFESFPNLYNRSRENFEAFKNDLDVWQDIYTRLIDVFQSGLGEPQKDQKELKGSQSIKVKIPIVNNNQASMLEVMVNLAMKYSSNEIVAIHRNFNGLNEKSKNCRNFLDVGSNGKIDKNKQQKVSKLRDMLWNKLNDENKFSFTVNWNDDIFSGSNSISDNNNTSITINNENNENNSSTDDTNNNNNSNSKNNDNNNCEAILKQEKPSKWKNQEFLAYLQNFNEVVVNKIKNLVEKCFINENIFEVNSSENIILQEATRHLYKFQRFNEKGTFGLDEMNERVKKLISFGIKNEHFPIFIYGVSSSGKTITLTKFGYTAINVIGIRSCQIVIRYCDLTSHSSTFEALLYSICEQLTVLQKLNPRKELPKKENMSELTKYFHKIIGQIAKSSQKQLLILIDGIQDALVDKSLIEKANIINNNLQWLFTQQLPPKVHLIVSIKIQPINNVPQTTLISQQQSSLTINHVSLLKYYFELHLNNLKENYIFDLPFKIKTTDLKELSAYLKTELIRCGKSITDEQIQVIFDCLNIKQGVNSIEPNVNKGDMTPLQNSNFILLNNNCETNVQLYLHFLIKHLQKCTNFKTFLTIDNIPKDVETLIKIAIERIEKIFNSKIVSFIFNYITASHTGLTEMELFDILSCNNEFFFDYYTHLNLPSNLRFPPALWIFIKSELGDLLYQKYMDNKITYCWSYECVKKVMKQSYFNKVDTIRSCHKDIANYFLESFVLTKPFVDMSKNLQIRDEDGRRYVCQQPLLYSSYSYNLRRLDELWYHLMNSGDIQRLKEHSFINFEYLLAKCHGNSLQNLLNDVDSVLKRILDTDILLLNSLLKKSISVLSDDPLKLATEILLRLRSLQEDYGTHIKSLIKQAIDWCENYPTPILIPLSSWLESPENLLITKLDNPDGILKLAITSFNQHVFFSTQKNEICMYHVPSKKLVKKFNGHADTVNSLQISYSNRFLVSASSDQLVKLWNLATGEVENTFGCNNSPILCIVLAHSDDILITGCKNRAINLIRIDTGEIINTLNKHEDAVTALALSLDDTILISASLDKTIKRWSIKYMELIENITTIYSPVITMTITSDNLFIIAACENQTVQVKSLVTGSDVHELVGHNAPVTSLAVSNDCSNIFVGCSNSKLYLYDIKSKELIAVFTEQDSSINDLKVSNDGSFLFSASGNSLFVFNLKKQNLKSKKNLATKALLNSFAISREGDVSITGDNLGFIKLWNLVAGEVTDTIIDYPQAANRVTLSHSYLFSVAGFNDGIIQVYDNEIGEIISDFREHTAPIRHLRILEDNHKILSADEENHIKVWWSNTGVLVDSFTVPCQSLSCSPDGTYVVSGSGDNTLKIWHLGDAKVVRQIDHPDKITTMVFTEDSNHIITGGEDCSCKIWEITTGKLIQVLIEHDEGITSIAVPNPSNYVVSGSKDKQVLFWHFKEGSVIHKLNGHTDVIVKVQITSDATLIFSASKDGLICVWSSIQGQLLNSVNTQFSIADILIASNGNRLIARFTDSNDFPIFSLYNKLNGNLDNKVMSQINLKTLANDKKTLSVLPIKPKPLIIPKQRASKRARINFINKTHNNSILNDVIQTEPVSVSQTNNGAREFFKRKIKRKDNRSNDFSSTLSIVPNGENKHKKTKICCLL